MKQRQTTDGARLLREFLSSHGITLNKFCDTHGFDYAWVHRVISGERGQRVSVDFARSMEKATGGAVPWDSWCSDTLRAAGTADPEVREVEPPKRPSGTFSQVSADTLPSAAAIYDARAKAAG